MKRLFILSLIILSASHAFAQSDESHSGYKFIDDSTVQAKNFYLLTLISQDSNVRQLVEDDPELASITKTKLGTIRQTLAESHDLNQLVVSLAFTEPEHQAINKRLGELYDSSVTIRQLVAGRLIPSGTHILNENLPPRDQFIRAWEEEGSGINQTINVYGGGKKPNYPTIDSISFNVKDTTYIRQVEQVAKTVLTGKHSLFFKPSMTAALLFLDLNGRNDAGNYEPMAQTVNKVAFDKIKQLDWSKYPYSALVVPGEGPEIMAQAISPGGIARCKLAALAYRDGQAPFIIVSGGKVHPYKTPFCEAEEMKRYLTDSLQIPAGAVMMEPHARHTTTNLRNSVRLMIRYHFPAVKPGLIVTDKDDNDYIAQMDKRCLAELKYVPYLLGNRVSDTRLEFYTVNNALQINPNEPLDP